MKKNLIILIAVFAFITMAAEVLAPVYAVFVEKIGGDLLTAGGAFAVFSVVVGVVIFFVGKLEDRYKHLEKFIVIGFCIKTIGFVGYVFVSETIHLFLVQIVLGIGEAIAFPAYDALYSKYLEKGKYASQWGAWESMNYIVLAVAGFLGGAIAQFLGFQMLFFFMIIMSLAGVFVSLRLLHLKQRKRIISG